MDAKIWVLLALLTIVNSRDLFVGSNDSGHKIYEENKKANPAIWRQTENVTIVAEDGEVINKLVVTDLRDEKDGEVKIVEGGEGQRNVTIELKSPTVLRGYDFHIEAYAISNNKQASSLENENTEKASKKGETNMNSSPRAPITPQLFSSTSDNPLIPSEIEETKGKRQNREVENKNKSTQQPMHPLDDVSTSTKTPYLQSTVTPKSNENRENDERKVPSIYEVHEHDNINQPSIYLQEPSKISESAVKNIPSTEMKTMDANNSHQEGATTTNDMVRHTSVDYPKFYIHEINTAAPINKKDINIADNNKKTESFRQKRDVVDVQHKPRVDIKENTGILENKDARNTGEINDSNNEKQNPLHKNSNTNTATSDQGDVRNNKNFGHAYHHHADEDTKHLDGEQNRPHTYRGRQIPQRFGFKGANEGTRLAELPADISKTSTLLPINSQTKALNEENEKSTGTNTVKTPKFPTNELTTSKAEITTANTQVADKTDKLNGPVTITENNRSKRDVLANKNDNKGNPKPMTENSSLSTSTLQPNDNKNAAVSNKNADAPSKIEIPIEIPKQNERPSYTPNSSTTTKPVNKNGEDENTLTTQKQKNIPEPVGPKSKTKTAVTENITEEKERISRDTNTVNKFKKDDEEKVSSTTEVAKEADVEKEMKKTDEIVENKPSVPVMIGVKDQKQEPMIPVSISESTPNLQGNPKNDAVDPGHGSINAPVKDQKPKLLREGRKVDLKDTEASLNLNKEHITLSADTISKDLPEITLLKKAV